MSWDFFHLSQTNQTSRVTFFNKSSTHVLGEHCGVFCFPDKSGVAMFVEQERGFVATGTGKPRSSGMFPRPAHTDH